MDRSSRAFASASNAPCALVCLDFDLTLLRVHSFAERVRAEDVRTGARDGVGDFVDVGVFRKFVGACVEDASRWMGRDGRMDGRAGRARGGDGTDETRGEALAKERGIVVKIASFGNYDVIQAYCDLALGDGVMTREYISTPSVVGSRDGCSVEGGKNKQLQKICEEMYGTDAWKERVDTVVLFDDDERNVAAAIASGFRAVHTPEGFDARAARIIFPNDF